MKHTLKEPSRGDCVACGAHDVSKDDDCSSVRWYRDIHWIRGDGKTGCRADIKYEGLTAPPSHAAATSAPFGALLRVQAKAPHLMGNAPCGKCTAAFRQRAADLGLDEFGCSKQKQDAVFE